MQELITLGRDLTELARAGKLDPVVGREREMDELLLVLCRRTKNNPLLLGEPGVGKTALAEGLAQLLATNDVPQLLRGRRLFELQLGPLLAGTQFRGDLEKRLQDFIRRAQAERTIVFIDEIHLLVVAGRGSGMDAGNLLKPILARGEVPCIGATTPAEASEMFRVDPAMERRFQAVSLAEPRPETVRAILRALRPRLETHHGVAIADDAIEAAVEYSLSDSRARKNPDRALDILEDTCAAEQLRLSRAVRATPVPGLAELEAEVLSAIQGLDLARHVRAREAVEAALVSANLAEFQRLRRLAYVGAAQVKASVGVRSESGFDVESSRVST